MDTESIKEFIAAIIFLGFPILIISILVNRLQERRQNRRLHETALVELQACLCVRHAEGAAAVPAGEVMDAIAEELSALFPDVDGPTLRAVADNALNEAWKQGDIDVARRDDGRVSVSDLIDTDGNFNRRDVLIRLAKKVGEETSPHAA